MMIKVALAIGLGIFVLVAICCVSWGVWKLRHRMSKGQISATPDDIPVQNRKDVVLSSPTLKTSDLKVVDGGAKLRCPICWRGFRREDIMRQLPQCEHIFHRRCIDPLLDTKLTCPVCSSVVTDGVKGNLKQSQESMHSRTPSWVLVNRPVPLPRTVLENSSSSSERFEIELNAADSIGSREGESPLLKHVTGSHAEAWNDVDLEKCIDISFTFGTDIPVEKRQQSSSHASAVDSFSFGVSGADGTFTFAGTETAVDAAAFRSSLRRSRGRDSNSTSSSEFKHSRSTSRSSRSTNSSSDSSFKHITNWEHNSVTDHVPLTRPPDQTPFDVLPVINGSENHSLRLSKVGSNRGTYSHL